MSSISCHFYTYIERKMLLKNMYYGFVVYSNSTQIVYGCIYNTLIDCTTHITQLLTPDHLKMPKKEEKKKKYAHFAQVTMVFITVSSSSRQSLCFFKTIFSFVFNSAWLQWFSTLAKASVSDLKLQFHFFFFYFFHTTKTTHYDDF